MRKISCRKDFYIRLSSLSIGVTGSCNHLLSHYPDGREEQIVIDCGMFWEGDKENLNRTFLFDCKKIIAALVTHEHGDHCARIPCLFSQGFRGQDMDHNIQLKKLKQMQ